VTLTQAIYFPGQNFVALVPKGQRKLPKLEQLNVNVSIVTDPQGRPINNGVPLTAKVTNTGLIVSSNQNPAASAPTAAAVDALFEHDP
jgi:hypothetical protein